MLSRKKLLIFSGLLLTASIGIGLFLRNSEPRYNGRTITEWCYEFAIRGLDGDAIGANEAELAIRQIGTNGIPFLLERMGEEPSTTKTLHVLRSVPIFGDWLTDIGERRRDEPVATVNFFKLLGPECKSAIPALSNLVDRSTDLDVRHRAITSLIYIGDDASPSLCHFLDNPKHPACLIITALLGSRYYLRPFTNRVVFVPNLVELSTNSDPRLNTRAVRALGSLALQADIVIPFLTNAFNHTNAEMRKAAVYALGQFRLERYVDIAFSDPDEHVREAATNAFKLLTETNPAL